MDDRELARQFALARVALGAVLLVAPSLVGGPWLGRRVANSAGGRVLLRAAGVRDLALGLGLKTALDRDAPTRGWIEGGIAADGVDAAATLLAGDELPTLGRVLGGSLAAGGVAVGARLRRSAEVGSEARSPEAEAARAGADSLASP